MLSKRLIGLALLVAALIAIIVVGVTALTVLRNPVPHTIEQTLPGGEEITLSADRTHTLFAGDCIGLIWDNRYIQTTFINDSEVPGYGEITHCDGTEPEMYIVRWNNRHSETFVLKREILFNQPVILALSVVAVIMGIAGIWLLGVLDKLQNPFVQYGFALIVAVISVVVIDLFTNSLNTLKFGWDHTHYIDMAENGITDNLFLVAPYAYRPATPLLAGFIGETMGRSAIAGFRMLAYGGAIAQLLLVFALTRQFTRRFWISLTVMGVVAFSAFNVKFLLFDIYRPDHLAYPLLILGMMAVFRGNIIAVLVVSIPGLLVREYLLIPPLLIFYRLGRDFLRGRNRKTATIIWMFIIAGTTAASYMIPRLLIYSARSSQMLDPLNNPDWLSVLVTVPLNLARDYNLLLGLVGFMLPLVLLVTSSRLRRIRERLGSSRSEYLTLYTLLVLGMALYGGTDVGRFMAYLYIPLAIILVVLLDEGHVHPGEIVYMLLVVALFNRLLWAIPMTNLDAHLDFYAAHDDRINAATFWRTAELALYVTGGLALRAILFRRAKPAINLVDA